MWNTKTAYLEFCGRTRAHAKSLSLITFSKNTLQECVTRGTAQSGGLVSNDTHLFVRAMDVVCKFSSLRSRFFCELSQEQKQNLQLLLSNKDKTQENMIAASVR